MKEKNKIQLLVSPVSSKEAGIITSSGIDILDNTPLIDIKPYVPEMDKVDSSRIGWLSKHTQDIYAKKSDQRFK